MPEGNKQITKPKLVRIATISKSLEKLLEGQLEFMSEHYDITAVSSEADRLKAYGRKEGVKTFFLPLSRKISPIRDLKCLWRLYRFLRKEKPMIVHSHTPKAGTIGMLAAKFAGVPHRLHTVAGMPLVVSKGLKRKLLLRVERMTYKRATKVYPNSFGMKQIIEDLKLTTSEKLKVIGNGSSNGIDLGHFDPAIVSEPQKMALREELGIASDDIVFLFIGRIVKDKGINELTEAFKKVNNKNPGTKLVLVGRYERELDPLKPETEKEINSNPSIVQAGYQVDVRPFLAMADVLTFPSYREGFPNVVMQACAMRLPVIATNINGCNELIRDGENGFLIPVEDAEELKNKMEYLIGNPGTLDEMANQTREYILNNFERQYVWNELLKEYRSLEG